VKNYKNIVFIISLISSPILMAESLSINSIHSCLALVDFVNSKVKGANDTYSSDEKELIHKGLSGYSEYLDKDVINPKLLKLYGGNASQAKLMKKLFSRQQGTFTQYLDDRYSEKKLLTDYSVGIQECSVKTGSQGDVALALKKAINTMAKK
jgi:hypothetical protein